MNDYGPLVERLRKADLRSLAGLRIRGELQALLEEAAEAIEDLMARDAISGYED